jgi:hypothetical protein
MGDPNPFDRLYTTRHHHPKYKLNPILRKKNINPSIFKNNNNNNNKANLATHVNAKVGETRKDSKYKEMGIRRGA